MGFVCGIAWRLGRIPSTPAASKFLEEPFVKGGREKTVLSSGVIFSGDDEDVNDYISDRNSSDNAMIVILIMTVMLAIILIILG